MCYAVVLTPTRTQRYDWCGGQAGPCVNVLSTLCACVRQGVPCVAWLKSLCLSGAHDVFEGCHQPVRCCLLWVGLGLEKVTMPKPHWAAFYWLMVTWMLVGLLRGKAAFLFRLCATWVPLMSSVAGCQAAS